MRPGHGLSGTQGEGTNTSFVLGYLIPISVAALKCKQSNKSSAVTTAERIGRRGWMKSQPGVKKDLF